MQQPSWDDFAASTASLEHPHSLGIIQRLTCPSVRASHPSAMPQQREPSHVSQCRFTAYAAGPDLPPSWLVPS
jgi:hypothetical protein